MIPWPALGGAVEVWVAEVPAGLEDDLVGLLGTTPNWCGW